MLTLAFHTAGPACELALTDRGVLRAEIRQSMQRGQDVHLPGLTRSLCEQAGCSLSQIDRFAVITGPGSFTGIRIGVAFARGLALALDKVCLGITSLEASQPEGFERPALILLPAQKRPPDKTFWVQAFHPDQAHTVPEEVRADGLRQLIDAGRYHLYGDYEAVQSICPDWTVCPAFPTARRAALLAEASNPHARSSQPVYVRAPDATRPGQDRK